MLAHLCASASQRCVVVLRIRLRITLPTMRADLVARERDEALRLLEGQARYDLAFIDLKLGEAFGGVEVARRANQLGVQVIVMTGVAQLPGDIEGAALLSKPFSVEAARHVFDAVAASRAKHVASGPPEATPVRCGIRIQMARPRRRLVFRGAPSGSGRCPVYNRRVR